MQDKESQKNLLLAIVLSMAVLFAWQFFYAAPREQERQTRIRQEQAQQAAKATEQPAPGATSTAAAPGVPQGATPTGQAQQPGATLPGPADLASTVTTRQGAIDASPRVGIQTPSLKGSISLKGGRIDDLVLAKYRETVDPKSPNVELFSPSSAPHPYYAEFGWSAGKGATQPMPGRDTLWRMEKGGSLTPESPVTLAWDNGQGLLFRRTISVDPDYLFKVKDEVENKSRSAVSLYPYALISRHGMPKLDGVWMILHEGFIGAVGESGLKEVGYTDVLKDNGAQSFKQTAGWLGFTDKYWATALIPDTKTPTEARFSGNKGVSGAKDTFQVDVSAGPIEIAPGTTQAFSSHLFAGAKVVSLIDDYNTKLGARQFDMLVDWGMLWFLTQPLYILLHWLGQLFGNYGLAILAATVLVKALFFPLANKSYESMAKMKLLQPEMQKLRERYPDDRAKQQQEMMALYREKKINPMAGCLPILLQVPVFFALYKVLYVTIDMRQTPFFGWIKDLSAPDPTSIFNLFGLLPFAPPEFLPHLGVWPIIMGMTMWVQMQLNPQQADPLQQKIFNWMPVMFTFLLANFASGLVIYWAWNNLLSVTQQYLIMKRNGAEIHLWRNLGVETAMAKLGPGGQGGSSGGSGSSGAAGGGAGGDFIGRAGASVRGGVGKLAQRADAWKKALGGGTKAPPPAEEQVQPEARATPSASHAAAAGDGHGDGHAAMPKVDMTRDEALRALGLQPGATRAQIDAAYRARARQKGSLNGSEKLSRARDVLRGEG
jgi:YidC/Oxa1 family membrane protein insertase